MGFFPAAFTKDVQLALRAGVLLVLLTAANLTWAGTFKQEALSYLTDGSPLPATLIQPATMPHKQDLDFSLGQGRKLRIETNLPPTRNPEIEQLAGVVQRCYQYLERETGRTIPGGVMLYLVQFEQRPRCYRFSAETDDADGWAQVRVALLDANQPLLGTGASAHVTEFLYDTLPHELTHNLLMVKPTVRHDLDGGPTLGTRWFIEGVCEKTAKGFSAQEDPAFHRQALRDRNIEAVFSHPELKTMVWHWGQNDHLSWSDESDLYGLSLLMVTAWCEYVALPDLLARMSAEGGTLDGTDLINLLQTTSPLNRSQLLARAGEWGWRLSAPATVSSLP